MKREVKRGIFLERIRTELKYEDLAQHHEGSEMARVVWSKIAKVLREEYMEGMKCKLCGQEIEEGENALKTLNNIYKHFKEKHPETIEEVKSKLAG